MNEVLRFAAWQIANILKVDDHQVKASWILEDGKVKPKFEVDATIAKGLEPSEIREVLSNVYGDLSAALTLWLRANKECRDGHEAKVIEAKKAASEKSTKKEEGPVQEEAAAPRESGREDGAPAKADENETVEALDTSP